MLAFLELIDNDPMKSFLENHPEIDRYYIACCYVYFQRASLHIREFTPRKFALALHIVNAMKVGITSSCHFPRS